jgi:Ca2+-binding RTX toxin-like protein
MQVHLFDASEITSRTQALLSPFEGFEPRAYWDGASPINRPSIGLGFNLEAQPTNDYLILVLGQKYGASTLDILGFVNGFRSLMQYPGFRPSTAQYLQNKTHYDNQLQAAMDNLVTQNLLPGGSFMPLTLDRPQADTVERQILEGYSIGGASRDGKLIRLQRLLFDVNQISIPSNSNEFIALASLYYNSESLIGGKILSALKADNRAEAWYQIRYESNQERISNLALARGIANRRYAESDKFSLYENASVNETEAKSIFRMYTEHREAIYTYESDSRTSPSATDSFAHESQDARNFLVPLYSQKTVPFGPGVVTLPAIDGEVLVGTDDLAGDRFDLRAITIQGVPASVFELSKNDLMFGEGGRDFLHGRLGNDVLYGGDSGDELFGDEGQDVLFGDAGADTLQGGVGDDSLFGGAGNDTLVGGAGNDNLAGGEGFDTYFINSTTDGVDTIEDSDAKGVIKIDGRVLTGGVKKPDGNGVWKSADGYFEYRMVGTDLKVTVAGTSVTLTVNENFQSGQFGIRLIDAQALPAGLPTISRTIEGDHEPKDFNPDPAIVEYRGDDLGNFLYAPGAQVPWLDILLGSGGNDRIDAGEMRDYLLGFGGDDVLVGGAGNDRLLGGDGNDFLFSDGVVDLAGLPSLDTFTGVGTLHEFLNGDADNDVLLGGAVGDALFGATGADLLLGGAGDDFLAGDANYQPDIIPNGWGFSFMPGTDFGVNLSGLVPAGPEDTDLFGQADEIYGGAGTDLIWGGGGNDLLYGGQGDDRISGDGGDDAIFGGDGNDKIQGDQPATVVTSNDYLDGGNGDDILIGGHGDDVLVGGAGVDHLYGDATNLLGVAGSDVLDGGDGNDVLYGQGGDDTLFGGAGDDELIGDFSNDTVPGNDRLFGDAGADLLLGEAGDDELDGGDDHDVLLGGAGNDVLFGAAGDDVLLGESTSFQGVAGDDLLDGGDGDDELQGSGGADTLWGGAGNDQLFGDDPSDVSIAGGNDWLDGEDGIDELQGGLGHDTLFGGDGDDVLFGDRTALDPTPSSGGDDVLDGEAGNDNLFGDSGNDVLTGGIGNDSLDGGAGQDTYVFNLGDGVDTIQDAVGEGNRLLFGGGVDSESVTLGIESGDTLLLRVGSAGDAVRIAGFGVNTPTGSHPIDHFEFADGTVLTYSQLVARGFHQYGTAGSESLVGSGFIDHIEAGAGNDVVSGLAGADTLLGEDGHDVLGGDAGDDTLDGGAGNDQLFGGDGADLLYGGVGDDLLNADTGADQLFGGIGNDTYVVSAAEQAIVESAGEGIDTVQVRIPGSFTFVLPTGVENVELVGDVYFPSDRIDLVGNQFDNRMTGSDLLNGGQGNDTLIGVGDNIYVFGRGDGQDVIQTGVQDYATAGFVDYIQLLPGVAPADVAFEGLGNHLVLKIVGTTDQLTVENYLIEPGLRTPTIGEIRFDNGTIWGEAEITSRVGVMTGTSGNDNLTGFGNDNNLFGLGGNDQLVGYGGNDRLDGGVGDDLLVGGDGNDTYLFGRGAGQDRVSDFPDSGIPGDVDTVLLDSTVAPADVRLQATADSSLLLTISGTTDSLLIEGYFFGSLYQIEQIQFSDSTIWNASAIASRIEGLTLVGTEGDDALTGIQTNDTLVGLGGNDTLDGGSGNDTLDGGSGADTMAGNTGNDLYFVGDPGDVVIEQTGQGTDTVNASITYTLGANVEHLALTGTNAINGTGNSGNNTLTGNSAANILTGGTGNDTYVVGAGDTVTEAASAGTDTVQSAVSWTLGNNVENLTLTGTLAINGTGNTLNNALTGNAGNNVLDGGAGNDTMVGGAGDDTFVVNVTGDVVTENANEGTDTVLSAVTRTLGANFENLTLTGTAAINGTGNTLNNVLTGNSAANTLTGGAGHDMLDGGAGNDTMVGGTGNDTYVVNATGDIVTENANEGADTVLSAVTRTLGANFENLTLTGTTAVNGTGNTLDNVLTGNSAVNTLTGGAGNDTYVVGTGDTVTEAASAGTDTVQSAVTWTLGANLENLTLIGSSAINGTGNTLNNTIAGNSANNTLTGLGGNDTYLYGRGGGQDTVIDNSGASDSMLFGLTINPLDLVITRQVNDLRLAIHGSADSVTIQNWYTSPTMNQVETIQAGNGQTMLNSQVDQLIQAMATFTTQSGLTWDQAIDQRPQDVQTVLAASWH